MGLNRDSTAMTAMISRRIDADPHPLMECGADELARGLERDAISLGDDRGYGFDIAVAHGGSLPWAEEGPRGDRFLGGRLRRLGVLTGPTNGSSC